ncbi:MAG: hypothetical protein HZA46_22895 [Planctomycetales bacterium]|nr:hypothetical protein [Planctomycetales bacterium]
MRYVLAFLAAVAITVLITIGLHAWLGAEELYRFRMEALGTELPASTTWRFWFTTRILKYMSVVIVGVFLVAFGFVVAWLSRERGQGNHPKPG